MKLEIKHLAPYLPFYLKVFDTYSSQKLFLGLITIADCGVMKKLDYPIQSRDLSEIKPILRPLSDLTKYCDDLEFIPYNELTKEITNKGWLSEIKINLKHPKYLPYLMVEKLFEWHFDVFGLIENGLAIDINTI